MRLTECRSACVAAALAGLALAGCSSASTEPSTSENVVLMTHFDSLLNAAPRGNVSQRRQLAGIITVLALGAPVRTLRVTLPNGHAVFSAVGAYLVTDGADGHPTDSAYAMYGWRGLSGDSLVSLNLPSFPDEFVFSMGSTAYGSGGSDWSLAARAPGGTCTSYIGQAPPDIAVPAVATCRVETTAVSSRGEVVIDIGIAGYDIPLQALPGIRVETRAGS